MCASLEGHREIHPPSKPSTLHTLAGEKTRRASRDQRALKMTDPAKQPLEANDGKMPLHFGLLIMIAVSVLGLLFI
jgi:hypothetical protein